MSTKNNPTITEKMAMLRDITAWFDSDEFVIEQATGKFAEAEKLARDIEQDLAHAKNDITVLKQKFDQAA